MLILGGGCHVVVTTQVLARLHIRLVTARSLECGAPWWPLVLGVGVTSSHILDWSVPALSLLAFCALPP